MAAYLREKVFSCCPVQLCQSWVAIIITSECDKWKLLSCFFSEKHHFTEEFDWPDVVEFDIAIICVRFHVPKTWWKNLHKVPCLFLKDSKPKRFPFLPPHEPSHFLRQLVGNLGIKMKRIVTCFCHWYTQGAFSISSTETCTKCMNIKWATKTLCLRLIRLKWSFLSWKLTHWRHVDSLVWDFLPYFTELSTSCP